MDRFRMCLLSMPAPERFPCTQCGECCRHVDRLAQLADFDRGDGVCIHLVGNLCDIYASRPEICCVDRMYERYFASMCSRQEFYRINLAACKQLQKDALS